MAHLAILALEATPDYMIDPELEVRLLTHVGARLIGLRSSDGKNLILRGTTPPLLVDATVDLSDRGFIQLLEDGIETLTQAAQPGAAGKRLFAARRRCHRRRRAG